MHNSGVEVFSRKVEVPVFRPKPQVHLDLSSRPAGLLRLAGRDQRIALLDELQYPGKHSLSIG